MDEENKKKINRLHKVLENGGETKDVVMFDMFVEELSNYFDTSTESIVNAIQKLQDREEKETVVNIEAPVVNVPEAVVNVPAPIVNVEAPNVTMDMEEMCAVLDSILKQLKETPQFNLEEALAKFIKDDRIKVNVDRVGTGVGGVVTFPIVDAINNASRDALPLAIQMDDVSTSGYTYIGKATLGSATSSPVWQICRIDETGSPITFVQKWASGGRYNQVWSDRTSLSYT